MISYDFPIWDVDFSTCPTTLRGCQDAMAWWSAYLQSPPPISTKYQAENHNLLRTPTSLIHTYTILNPIVGILSPTPTIMYHHVPRYSESLRRSTRAPRVLRWKFGRRGRRIGQILNLDLGKVSWAPMESVTLRAGEWNPPHHGELANWWSVANPWNRPSGDLIQLLTVTNQLIK